MLLMTIDKLEKSFGDKLLFELDHLEIFDGDRIGLTGVNGAGKSTLMKLLAGRTKSTAGAVNTYARTAYIPQLDETSLEEIGMSGGEWTKSKIKSALKIVSGIIFADEPTSHLDISGIEWLKKALISYKGAIVLISHDEMLMDAVCTKIIDIDKGIVTEYPGNFTEAMEQKAEAKKRAEKEYETYRKERVRLRQAIQQTRERVSQMDRPPSRMGRSEWMLHKGKAAGKKAKVDQSTKRMEARLEQLEVKEKPAQEKNINFFAEYLRGIHGKNALQFDGLSLKQGDGLLFSPFSYAVKPGTKLALIGSNGCGKSTLLKHIYSGGNGVSVSPAARIGYYAQDLSTLHEEATLLENVLESSPYPETRVRETLDHLLFTTAEVNKRIEVMSGGERSKAMLAKIFLGDYNILLLDEPTNFLDIYTQRALSGLLKEYPGTVIFASHNQSFLEAVSDEVIAIEDKKITVTLGGYKSYQEKKSNSGGGDRDQADELRQVELAITAVLGEMSLASDEKKKEELDQVFKELLEKKKGLGQ